MRSLLLASAAALLIGAAPPKLLTPNDIVAQSPAAAWKTIPADDLMVLDLANGGRVVIQLAPAFAPVHVAELSRIDARIAALRPSHAPPEAREPLNAA